ncbi:MAG: aryl-alcohol dehydrogenase-like predicted oxidoreductase [Planctomycetota bacterium]|jgi:aryl-alcohol dehydrogenase-like predicted oxidoreductase
MNEKCTVGQNGPQVHRVGYGAMALAGYYGRPEEGSGPDTLKQAFDLGMMIDTADAYGNGSNESLIGQTIASSPATPYIATKFGIVFDKGPRWTEIETGWGFNVRINGTPEYAMTCLDNSLERLGVDCIDLWYAHYADPSTPIEETVGAMADAVKAGKVRQLGLSNVTADELRRANAVHPIAAVQYEYSLWRREAEEELLPAARELGTTLVAWSPLGSGFLTGAPSKMGKHDLRNFNPRFDSENLKANAANYEPLLGLASELGINSAQLALAWLLHQDGVIPIPGTRRSERVLENAQAIEIELDTATLQRIDEVAPLGLAAGKNLL